LRQFALGIFLDIEGAFDAIKFESIKKAMYAIKIPEKIIKWIYTVLTDRKIQLEINGFSLKRKVYRGCPQGGILSPLLWNLSLNTPLKKKELDDIFKLLQTI
jgi:retron-type reverse transcriptase